MTISNNDNYDDEKLKKSRYNDMIEHDLENLRLGTEKLLFLHELGVIDLEADADADCEGDKNE